MSKCALLAVERENGDFYGFRTDEPTTVDHVVNHLNATCVSAESDGDDRTAAADG